MTYTTSLQIVTAIFLLIVSQLTYVPYNNWVGKVFWKVLPITLSVALVFVAFGVV